MAGAQGQAWLSKTNFYYAEFHPHFIGAKESLRVSLQALFDAKFHVLTFPSLEHPSPEMKGKREWIYFACADHIGKQACVKTCRDWKGLTADGDTDDCTHVPPTEESIKHEYAQIYVARPKKTSKKLDEEPNVLLPIAA